MSLLFSPGQIGRIHTKNRLIRSATYYALSDIDGFASPEDAAVIGRLAAGKTGLVITGFAYVEKSGQAFADMSGVWSDEHIPGLAAMAAAAHENGGRAVMQIAHCGRLSRAAALLGGDYMAVSAPDADEPGPKPRQMTEADIQRLIHAFGQAARRVEEAGFDGVQLHAAHGYLISEFLSPLTNRRTDRWGGRLENRQRFLMEVAREVKETVSPGFTVMAKLGVRDFAGPGGLIPEEGADTARRLSQAGLDLIEVSNGLRGPELDKLRNKAAKPEQEAYFRPLAQSVRAVTNTPLSLVGGIRSTGVMEELLESGTADFVSLCRPFIREPELAARLEAGAEKGDCLSCGGCFNPDEKGRMHIFCRLAAREA